MKVVINDCFGGFGLSATAECMYAKLSGFEIHRYKQTKYKWRDGEELYEKVSATENGFLTFTFKQDHGASFSEFTEDGYWYSHYIDRNDPRLIQVVEDLGDEASGSCASLKVVEIPDDVEWEIVEYDGNEHITESHRTWA